ncbi:MAG: type IX secretion system sortase PorU [Prevotella sp.]
MLMMALSICVSVKAQQFFNLTADEVKVDSVLPRFVHSIPLEGEFRDSVYNVSVMYPEFMDLTAQEIEQYKKMSGQPLPEFPDLTQTLALDRKKGSIIVGFCPLVFRSGKYQVLVSFMLKKESRPRSMAMRISAKKTDGTAAGRYVGHSVLSNGKWAKIRVPETGVYQLTEALARQAGFNDFSKVKIYGYGGNLQNESLNETDLIETDDLKEVPTCKVNGRRLFYAKGPVSWTSKVVGKRTRNPYSDYGYYFITQSEGEPLSVDSAAFVDSFYPSFDDYHSLYEVDGYAWYQGGRNLYDSKVINDNSSYEVTLPENANATSAYLAVCLSAAGSFTAQVFYNDSIVGTVFGSSLSSEYDSAKEITSSFRIPNPRGATKVKVSNAGSPVRIDYISMAWNQPFSAPRLSSSTIGTPEYVYNITNQDLHADGFADMVIIIPTSQKLRSQAERLKAFHETHDGLRVNIVPADELYNEFSSGTPDANAYRRYLKMLYDRAATEADMPKSLLLFGDCVWDNRMKTQECRMLNPDDYLLCYESEHSLNKVDCYVDDGFFCLLDDGEGKNPLSSDKLDIGVGRFPVVTESQAKSMVDKTIGYATNFNAGAWQNTLVFMGDDGNNNVHMNDINDAAEMVSALHPGYVIKKIMWDTYDYEALSTGKTYPEATQAIKQLQASGALIMDYGGHGSPTQISHEKVLGINDFMNFKNTNLPLWITASCDIMPFDGLEATIGEEAVLNEKGGAVAFYGTARTVYADRNKLMNMGFLKHVLSFKDGKPITLGEAQRLAKNELISDGQGADKDHTVNKLQYALLGDPALALCLPPLNVKIDRLDGKDVSKGNITLKMGQTVKVEGHIENAPQDFNGTVTATVRDAREHIICKLNNTTSDGAKTPFEYDDYTNVLYNGSNVVTNGLFELTFAVPIDINYSEENGMMNFYAVNDAHTLQAHGAFDSFVLVGDNSIKNDSIGPSIYCYLNSPSFVNGGKVNPTPYFVAQVSDQDGINAAGSGIGHDMELIIDGKMSYTYNLNDNFMFDFGSYTSGSTHYSLPELEPGEHRLLFRAWDMLNNSSTAELTFHVVKGLEPRLVNISCTDNPATTSTTFVIGHDRTGSIVDVEIDVFDMSGRHLWHHQEADVSTDSPYTVNWDLRVDSGARLQTGVYLYRVRLSSDGSSKVSKAKKLIVIGNK